jgi:hypothetical protein
MNDDGTPFCFLPVAPVVLFGKNAPPTSKSVMQIQPSTVKLTPKRKRLSEAVAPRARAKTRKVLVRKVRRETTPSSPNPASPVANQVRPLLLLCNRTSIHVFFNYTLFSCSLPLYRSPAGRSPHARRAHLRRCQRTWMRPSGL